MTQRAPQPARRSAGKKLGSVEQYGSHYKHTVPESRFPIQPVFSDPSTSAYGDHLVNAILAGAVEIDDLGRTNIIWAAGRETDCGNEFGHLIQPADAMKVVLSSRLRLLQENPRPPGVPMKSSRSLALVSAHFKPHKSEPQS